MGIIVTLSGSSGSGKTTLAEEIISQLCGRMIESVTSRPPRERDKQGEFLYLTPEEFECAEKRKEFLWVTPLIHGSRYGTLKESVGQALREDGIRLMIITVGYTRHLADNHLNSTKLVATNARRHLVEEEEY